MHTFKRLINESDESLPLNTQTLSKYYDEMGTPLFLLNIVDSIFKISKDNEKLNILIDFTLEKIKDLKMNSIDYSEDEILLIYEKQKENNFSQFNKLIYNLFQIGLKFNILSISINILNNIISKANKNLNDEFNNQLINQLLINENISLLIDMYSINRSQTRNVKELDELFQLVNAYNKLMIKLNLKVFEFSDIQIKSILDKSYYTLFKDVKINSKMPFEAFENYTSPYSTLEIVIREFGLIISKRVSNSISFYKKKSQNDETENEKNEDDDQKDLDYIKTIEEIMNKQLLNKYLQFCYFVIQDRCENNDPSSIFIIWKIIKPFHNKLYNSIINSETNHLTNNFYYYQTLSKMITIFSKNRRYRNLVNELIYDLPLDSVKICPELMSSILYHCGRTKNESLGRIVGSRYDDETSIRSNLKKFFGDNGDLNILGIDEKFTPGQVHAFLSYNLRLGKRDRSLEIISYLKDKLIGFSDIDFNELIRSILYSNNNNNNNNNKNKTKLTNLNDKEETNEEIVWKMMMINENDHKESMNKYAMITYLDFMINSMNSKPLNFERINEIFNFIRKNVNKNHIKYWDHFYMIYFKYLNRKFPLEISQTVYINSKKYTLQKFRPEFEKNIEQEMYFQKLSDYGFRMNPFMIKFNDVRIKMSENLRMIILRDIFQRSDGYLKRAKSLKSDDIEEAKDQFIKISQWVYKELLEIKYNKNIKNRKLIESGEFIDLLKTIDRKVRKIGFKDQHESKQNKIKIDKDELRYRVNQGESVAIGDITLDKEFENNIENIIDIAQRKRNVRK
jgi:hypothetical protein